MSQQLIITHCCFNLPAKQKNKMLIKLTLLSLLAFASKSSQQDLLPSGPEQALHSFYEQLNSQTFADVHQQPKFHNLSEAIAASEKLFETVYLKKSLPSLTVGYSVRNKTIFSKAWGQANLEDGVDAGVNTIYRLASVSKSFCSLVLGTLVDQGLVNYSDPLSKHLKASDYPRKSWAGHQVEITIGQLLSHMAGEPVTSLPDIATYHIEIQNITDSIRVLNKAPLTFAPGTAYNYSNYGYQLVGAVIESVTKKPYSVVLHEFFAKHGLTQSTVDTGNVLVHNSARYYQAESASKRDVNVPCILVDALFMANHWTVSGGMMSSVPDLLRYGNLFIDAYKGRPGSVISKATLQQIWTPRTDKLADKGLLKDWDYAYGWIVTDLGKNPSTSAFKHKHFVWHNGAGFGTSTYLAVYPEEEVVIVALANRGEAQSAMMMAAIQTMDNVYELVK